MLIVDIIGTIDKEIDNIKYQNLMINNQMNYLFKYYFYNHKQVQFQKTLPFFNKYCLKNGNNCVEFKGTKKYIATANVEGTNIESIDSEITFSNKPSRANNAPEKNTIWFAKMKNTDKKILIIDNDDDLISGYVFSTGFQGLKIDESLLFYYWEYVKTKEFEFFKDKICSGATQQAVDETTLKEITIKIPSNFLEEFNEITKKLNVKISQNRKSIKQLLKLKKLILPLLLNDQIS